MRRVDFEVCDDCREITALTFSTNGDRLVLGESGPNARFFILTLSDSCDQVLSKLEFRTKEIGFSCLAMDSAKGRLITVGSDSQPYFILWDTNQPRPTCIAYYHLAICPTYLTLSSDGSLAYLCGAKLLKFVHCEVTPGATPAVLQCRNAAIGQFKTATFVATALSLDPPFTSYALTNDGLLCVIESVPFVGAAKKSPPHKGGRIVIVPIRLDCEGTTSIVLDRKVILIGTSTGEILTVKRERDQHKVFGQFASSGKRVTAMGIGATLSAAAYDDGHLIFWPRRINSPPLLTIASHRGPVCGLCVLADAVATCGSDSTVRVWRLQKTQELIGRSSQEQLVGRAIARRAPDFGAVLTGVRCICARDDLLFAGDFAGTLHVLRAGTLDEVARAAEAPPGIICVAAHRTQPAVATGGGDGFVRVYALAGAALALTLAKQVHSGPVASAVFALSGLVTASSDGLRFCSLPAGKTYAVHKASEPYLALAAVPSEKVVVAAGCDNCISLFRTANGALLRQHKISPSAYPLALAVDRGGLFIAAALSDGQLQLLDLFSGDVLFAVDSHAGVVTSVQFHEGDLILASFSGPIVRWTLPECVHNAMAERDCEGQPLLGLMIARDAREHDGADARLRGSFMKAGKADADWVFREIPTERLHPGKPMSQDAALEEEDDVDQGGVDAPRPCLPGQYEAKVDDIVRSSFVRRKREGTETLSRKPSAAEELVVPQKERRAAKEKDRDKERTQEMGGERAAALMGETRAAEFLSAAVALKTAFDSAKRLIAVKPSCPEEVGAQETLREAFNAVRTEMVGNVAECKSEIRSLSEKILVAIQQLDV